MLLLAAYYAIAKTGYLLYNSLSYYYYILGIAKRFFQPAK